MRNYIVSTLVSLALASPFALADEVPAPEVKAPEMTIPEVKVPEVTIPKVKAPELPEHIAKMQAEAKARMEAVQTKRNAHHEEMQALIEQMKEAKTQEERQTLMQQRMELVQKHYQEMQELMRQDIPTTQTAPAFPPQMSEEEWKQMMQDRMQAAQQYREQQQQMYSMGSMSGYEGYATRYAYPPVPYFGNGYYAPVPNYNYSSTPQSGAMNRGKHCNMKKHAMKQDMKQSKMEHRAKMEQSMQNIEATLKELLELMKAK